MEQQRVTTPNPDPTELTRIAQDAMEATLRREIQVLRREIGMRFDAVDKATKLRLRNLEREAASAADLARLELQAEKELTAARLRAITAAAEKSEATMSTLLGQLQEVMAAQGVATDDKIADLKGRMDRGAGVGEGSASSLTSRRATDTLVWLIVSVVIALAGVATGIVIAFRG